MREPANTPDGGADYGKAGIHRDLPTDPIESDRFAATEAHGNANGGISRVLT